MVDIKPLLGSSFANIFSHSVCCLLILLVISFLQLLLTLIRSICFFFFAVIYFALEDRSSKCCFNLSQRMFSFPLGDLWFLVLHLGVLSF